MPKEFFKHKLLFDENLSPRTIFPKLNSTFDIKHIRDDLKNGGLPDPEVYKIAVKQKRILVTYNVKDFKSLAGTLSDAGIIGISSNLSVLQIDTKLAALLIKSSPKILANKLTSISAS